MAIFPSRIFLPGVNTFRKKAHGMAEARHIALARRRPFILGLEELEARNLLSLFPPVVTANPVSATEGSPFSGKVASFTDLDILSTPSDYSATITWGDGQTSSGTISGTGILGSLIGFDVDASNTYAEAGSYPISVLIQDTGGDAITDNSTATVADAPLSATGVAVSATEGTAFTGVVATFTDANPFASPGDFTATITWGDGNSSSGTIAANGNGGFNVTGTNTYAQEGSYPVSVSILDTGGSTTSATTTATVADAPLSATGIAVNATEGTAFTGVVATFTDGNPFASPGDFTATITWGDGNSSSGTITANGAAGGFSVSGTNTYGQAGAYPVSVIINDTGGASTSASSTATVADASLSATGVAVNATEGSAFSGLVATFSDGNPLSSPGDFTATITWGDGNTSSGVISANGGGVFNVTGTNTYAEEGSYPVSVSIHDVEGSTTGATTSATVADAPLTATGVTNSAVEGAVFTGVVATFTDADPGGMAGAYTATVTWGDGSSSTGTISPNGSGGFRVVGSHTFASSGAYVTGVTIRDVGGGMASATGLINVADAPLNAVGVHIAAIAGSPFSGLVAGFHDADPGGAVGLYSATIDWGDGSTSPGSIAAVGGNFMVSGTHTYALAASYPLSVTIQDTGGSGATTNNTATVFASTVGAIGMHFVATEGTPFTGVVAAFHDPGPNRSASSFVATINWGDDHTSPGTVLAGSTAGDFTVVGTNTYAEEGGYPVRVTLQVIGGNTGIVSSTATVLDAALNATGNTVSAVEGAPFTGVVASFQDADPGGMVSFYTAVINWGDGTSSAGSIAANTNGGFDVTGTKTYSREGNYSISVLIRDVGGSRAVALASATVADAPLMATQPNISTVEGARFRGIVVKFRDADPASTASFYSATIDWGDGTTSSGKITIDRRRGGFDVLATKTYAIAGSYPVRVTIQDIGGSQIATVGVAHVRKGPPGGVGVPVGEGGLTATGDSIDATQGIPFAGVIATFHDTSPATTAGSFSATIDWGDGTVSAGVVEPDGRGGFNVTGTNIYRASGIHTLRVSIKDATGQSVLAEGVADVVPSPSIQQASIGTVVAATSGSPKPSDAPPVVPGIPVRQATPTGFLTFVASADTSSSRTFGPPANLPTSSGGGASEADGSSPSAPTVKTPAVTQPAIVPVPQPPPAAPATPPAPPAVPSPAPAPGAPPVAPQAPVVRAPVFDLQSSQHDWAALEALKKDMGKGSLPHVVDAFFITGAVASMGYILFTSRSVFWLLSALTARPLWKQLDPLDVLFAWEKEKMRRREPGNEEDETLPSLVGHQYA